MVFGLRASYHSSQLASARPASREPPICPCAQCFNSSAAGGGGQDLLRAACASPARELRVPCGHGHHASNPFAGLYDRTRLGLIGGLKRRRSTDTMASDMRPLRKGAQDVPVVGGGGDGQSVLDEKF